MLSRLSMTVKPLRANSAVVLLVFAFCSIQLLLVWSGGVNGVFNSPDENANFHFALRVYEGLPFGIPSSGDGSQASDFLFSRSTRLFNGSLVPASFIGYALFVGLLSKVLFVNIIPFVTIFFAGAGLYAFYILLRRIFDEQIACLATFLLAIHPAWWYYTNASLFPNVLCISLLLIGFSLLLNEKIILTGRDSAAMLCIAIALLVRTSEAIWVLPTLMIFIVVNRKASHWPSLALASLPSIVLLFLFFVFAREQTGTASGSGYVLNTSEPSAPAAFIRYMLPFGFHPKLIVRNVLNFAGWLFVPFTAISFLGLYAVFVSRNAREKTFVMIWLAISVTLFIFYGSWDVRDTVSALGATIGASFVRYFLPYYALSAAITAVGIRFIAERFRSRSFTSVSALVLSALFVYGVVQFGFHSIESVPAKLRTVRHYDATATWVNEHTRPESIFVTEYADKYLWPGRSVITAIDHPGVFKSIRYFVHESGRPVYFLSVTLDDAKFISFQKRLRLDSLALADPIFTAADVSIYPFIKAYP